MIHDEDVLVAEQRLYWEFSGKIGVNFSSGGRNCADDFVGADGCVLLRCHFFMCDFGGRFC